MNFRSKVFKRAHELVKSTGKAFAVCLSKAWAIYRLTKRLLKGIVQFTYEKKDGSLRKATGTLKGITTKGSGSSSYKVLSYFDIEKNAFRCFKIENLITVY